MMFVFVHATEQLPLDKSFIQGELKNGLRYIIKKNDRPKNMASFRLVVKIGSLEEDDDQQGVAHLVEHLAFNGTKHFEKNSLIKFLESLGVDFGSHLNASTSFKETTYKLQIPLQNDNLEKSMLIFSDWASGIKFTQKELNKERGVILEEKRASNTLGYRIFKQVNNEILKNTRYTTRYPIGKEDVIKNINLKRVRNFYDTWYQPRFMNFVIVGDFEPKKVEKLIKKYFSTLKNTNDLKTYTRDITKQNEHIFKVFSDKELTKQSINISFFAPYRQNQTIQDLKNFLIKRLAIILFNLKAKEIALQKNPSAKNIGFYSYKATNNTEQYSFVTEFEKPLKAYKQLLDLIYTLEQNGFSEADFKLALNSIESQNKNMIKNYKNTQSSRFVIDLAYLLANNEPILDTIKILNLSNKLIKTISLKQVEQQFKQILNIKSKLTYFISLKSIDLNETKKYLINAKKNLKKPTKEASLPKDIELNLKPSIIKQKIYNKENDFYEYTLSNGVKLIYKYNDYEKNMVELDAFSKGGSSLYETDLLPNVENTAYIIDNSGFDKYNALEIGKIYVNKMVELYPFIDEFYEGFYGSSNTKDFEYLLKCVSLFAYKYRLDENILYNTKNQMLDDLKKEKNSPRQLFSRQFYEFYYNHNKRYTKFSEQEIKRINKKDILTIFHDRFSDFSDFTFFIIGDITQEKVEKYAKLYLATLPSLNRHESFKNRGVAHIKGKHKFIRNLNNENISSIYISYSKTKPYSQKEDIALQIFSDIIATRLREYIREEKSGVYGISFSSNYEDRINNEISSNISFSCEPKRKKELLKYIKKVLKDVQKNGVKQSYIDASVKKFKTIYEENRQKNSSYMQDLQHLYKHEDKILTKKQIDAYIGLIDKEKIKQMAKEYFNTKDCIYSELSPKI